MGYSFTALASYAMDHLLTAIQGDDNENSNTWTDSKGVKRFCERGREQRDDAITGTVFKFVDDNHCRPCGTYRIDSDGVVVRFPGSTRQQRHAAAVHAIHEHIRVHGWPAPGIVRDDHPGAYLMTASFVAV